MGAGLALEFRLREPEMCKKYARLCEEDKIKPGILWIYQTKSRQVLNFPTKRDWKHPSKLSYLELGLKKFAKTYRAKGIETIAFPLLGADKGGLNKEASRKIMLQYLEPLPDIEIEIYEHSLTASDDLYQQIKAAVLSHDIDQLFRSTKISKTRLEKIITAMKSGEFSQLGQLRQLQGIGVTTLETLYRLKPPVQKQLFREESVKHLATDIGSPEF